MKLGLAIHPPPRCKAQTDTPIPHFNLTETKLFRSKSLPPMMSQIWNRGRIILGSAASGVSVLTPEEQENQSSFLLREESQSVFLSKPLRLLRSRRNSFLPFGWTLAILRASGSQGQSCPAGGCQFGCVCSYMAVLSPGVRVQTWVRTAQMKLRKLGWAWSSLIAWIEIHDLDLGIHVRICRLKLFVSLFLCGHCLGAFDPQKLEEGKKPPPPRQESASGLY